MTIVKIPLEYFFYKQLDYMAISIISPFQTPILSLSLQAEPNLNFDL